LIKIRRIKPEETHPIRRLVLRKNIDLPYQFDGDLDVDAKHYGCFKNDIIVCVATVIKRKNKLFNGVQYQLRGMATLQEFQGNGYGKILLNEITEKITPQKVNIFWCNARVKAVKFYENCGFQKIGERFEIPQIGGHYVMFKKLK